MKHKQSEFDAAAIEQIEACIGYNFESKGLLRQAFTRSSYRNEHPWELDNEVLELMGDSVLSLSVLTYFKETYAKNTEKGLATDWDEGRLSALKNALVNKRQLASLMEQLGFDHTPHDTRHTCISLLTEADVNPTSIKKIVGHSGAMTLTERVYTHLDIETLVEAINKIT